MNRRNGNPIKCKKPAVQPHSRNIIEKKEEKSHYDHTRSHRTWQNKNRSPQQRFRRKPGTYLRNNDLGENPERIYEILGFTNAKFFGWNTIRRIRHFEYHGQTHGYFQYVCHKLVKCSFKQALITPDYKNYGIFIFSFQEEDDFWDYSEYYNTPRVVLIYK